MEKYATTLADLYLAIQNNNLEELQKIMALINADPSGYEQLFIFSDFEQLNNNSEAFNYFLNNIKLIGESDKNLWQYSSSYFINNFYKNIISKNELTNFINTVLANDSIASYKYINLIRIAMLLEDKALIIKLKNQMKEG